jgi:hypothetical protein
LFHPGIGSPPLNAHTTACAQLTFTMLCSGSRLVQGHNVQKFTHNLQSLQYPPFALIAQWQLYLTRSRDPLIQPRCIWLSKNDEAFERNWHYEELHLKVIINLIFHNRV